MQQTKPLKTIIMALVCTLIGLAGGYYLSNNQTPVAEAHAHGQVEVEDVHVEVDAHDESKPHAHDVNGNHVQQASESTSGHSHAGEDANAHKPHANHAQVTLSSEAIENLGLLTEKMIPEESFASMRAISAKIMETPKTVQPIFAPVGGIVETIAVEHGAMVDKDMVVMTIIRDDIKRPTLNIVANLLDPKQRLAGLSATDMLDIAKQTNHQKQILLWQKTLAKHGYWTNASQLLYDLLPNTLKNNPYVVAIIGELSVNGKQVEALHKWFKQSPKATDSFYKITSLLLSGRSQVAVQRLFNLGALASKVSIYVPSDEPNWDIHGVFVKIGEHIKTGQKLVALHNPRELHLEAYARGSEVTLLMAALKSDDQLSAAPLVAKSGPMLNGMTILNIQDEPDSDGGVVHLEVANTEALIKTNHNGLKYRSWNIRVGTKYLLNVPQKRFEEVYVVPNSAVVENGAEKQVYIKNGNGFEAVNVVVAYMDHEVAVLKIGGHLNMGDIVVTQGAWELALALKAQESGPVDAHAGHSH